MLTNYIKIALRILQKNKVYSLINICGMAVGLACVITIISYVRLELSYDRFHHDYDNIYRITTTTRTSERTAYNYMPLAPLLTQHVSGLKKAVRIFPNSGLVSIDKKNKIREANFCLADSTFFEIFDFKAIDGSLKDALFKPMSVVITRSAAIKYFNTVQAADRELFFEDDSGINSFNVAAVIEDMPENSHFNFNFIASFTSFKTLFPGGIEEQKSWYWPPMYIYAQMSEGNNSDGIDRQLEKIASSHLPVFVNHKSFLAQKLTDIHLNSHLLNEWQSNSDYSYISIFSIIAAFILLIACINYVNLATAKAAGRAGEVGIRKTMGSIRGQLIRMFIGESAMTSLLAIIIGLALAQFGVATVFESLLHRKLFVDFIFQWPFNLYLALGWVALSILSGIYPAFYISSFNTIKALKGKGEGIGSVVGLRKGLMAFQFFISAVLLIGALIVTRQISFLKEKKLGFDKDHIVAITINDVYDRKNYLNLKNKLLDESAVQSVTVSSALPSTNGFYAWEIVPEGYKDEKDIVVQTLATDEDFVKTYGVKLLAGRDFSKDIIADKEQSFIINEALAKKLQWEDPVGKDFQLTFHTDGPNVRKGKVIGLVEDFHFKTLYNRIEPLVIFINTHHYYNDYMSVRLTAGNIATQMEALQADWKTFSPEKPFEFTFLDDNLGKLYVSEIETGRMLSFFTALSIIISCLGLFGLSAFQVQQRTKEIGIRKVLGASELGIIQLISREFVVLVLVAFVLACPIVWYGANFWLARFAYRIDVDIVSFLVAIVLMLVITIATVGLQAIKAALANPVRALRSE